VGIARTKAGLRKCRAVRSGSRVALVAPASGFDRDEFDRGVAELRRLHLVPEYDDSVFARRPTVAGAPVVRAAALRAAWTREGIDAIIAVRGGYGSVETLPLLSTTDVPEHPAAFVGYSDLTSIHTWLNLHVGVTSVHGAMIDRRIARGHEAYDLDTFLGSLGPEPIGELAPDGLEVLRPGEADGPLFGGTLTQLAASLGTPYAFLPPAGSVLFIEDVGERPYRLQQRLMQLRLAGVLARASAVVLGQMTSCDEPGGALTARDVFAEFLADFPVPVLFGFPSGHTTTPFVSLPFGVDVRVVAAGRPRLVIEEAAAI
jgi:muramoyltetrapeptide carboxypeptidase